MGPHSSRHGSARSKTHKLCSWQTSHFPHNLVKTANQCDAACEEAESQAIVKIIPDQNCKAAPSCMGREEHGALHDMTGAVQVIRASCANAGVSPNALQCMELHGTGTPLGDPIEVGALAAVLAGGGARTAPLLLGAAKSHLGHAEPAAGASAVVRSAERRVMRQLPELLCIQRLPLPSSKEVTYPVLLTTAVCSGLLCSHTWIRIDVWRSVAKLTC